MIRHSNLSNIKNKILPTCLQGNYRDSLREFCKINVIHVQYGVVGADFNEFEHSLAINRILFGFQVLCTFVVVFDVQSLTKICYWLVSDNHIRIHEDRWNFN